jgi:hypothetical protein
MPAMLRDTPLLTYDPARLPGTYALQYLFVAGEARSNGGIGFELHPRADGRFDLFLMQLDDGATMVSDPQIRAHPIHDLSIDAHGRVDARLNPEGFLKDGGDLAGSFMFLLPETPAEPADVGATWTGTRTMPLGNVIPEHPRVTITYELLEFEPCTPPAGTETCAVYRFEANTGLRRVAVGEQIISYTYALTGVGRFSTAGYFLSAEAKLQGSLTFGDQPPQGVGVDYAFSYRPPGGAVPGGAGTR